MKPRESVSMHPRNPYIHPVDFQVLAAKNTEFRKACVLKPNGQWFLDFHKDSCVRALSRAILKEDFGLEVEMPEGSLVPRVPARLNYLLSIEDLLEKNGINRDVTGVDVGTGASCIYSLLGAARFGWNFVATDTCKDSLESAKRNVSRNGLDSKINVLEVEKDYIFTKIPQITAGSSLTFTMCNPPFFEESERTQKFCDQGGGSDVMENDVENVVGTRKPPKSATSAWKNELETEGGEVAFVNRMIDESILLRDKIKIYSSLLGKKSSVKSLQKRLDSIAGVRNTVIPIMTGKTCRWVLVWTYADLWLEEKSLSVDLSNLPNETNPLDWVERELKKLDFLVHRRDEGEEKTAMIAKVVRMWNRKRRRQEDLDLDESRSKMSREDPAVSGIRQTTFEESPDQGDSSTHHLRAPFLLQIRLSFDASSPRLLQVFYLEGCRQTLNLLRSYLQKAVASFSSSYGSRSSSAQ